MENNEKEREIITTEEDMDESDHENNENKKYDESRIYYVYEHIRLDKMEPFYIGKGKGERAYELYRNDHHDAITDEYGHAVVIIADNLTEEEAYWLERDTIEDYVFNLGYGIDIEGHKDYDHTLPHLTNMNWGGIGVNSGMQFSEEHKKNLSENHADVSGKNHPLYGKHHSEESKQKMSESHEGKEMSEETKQKISKKVICTTTGEIFNSRKDAGYHYGISPDTISTCCKGKRKTSGVLNHVPLQWKYLEDYNNEFKGILINPIIK